MLPEFQPLGDNGVRVCFGAAISPAISARVQRLGAALESEPIWGVTEWVFGYATVTVYYQPWIISYQTLCDELAARIRRRHGEGELPTRLIEIPVCYANEFGPDLAEVAAMHELTPAQVVQRHSRPRYLVYFLGFLPGFAYLGGLSQSLATPRRATPRASVPAGSVGIAGAQTGVYPLDSSGGWQIIGRTPLQLYDPARQPPALIRSGDRVKFVPITPQHYEELREYGPGG